MEYRQLGRTGLKVSLIGLGTMTFGEQNTEAEGHAQIDRALDYGVNLVDTSEMYSVPPRVETYGATERIIGSWIRQRRGRDRIVLATKVAGPGGALGLDYVRGGDNRLDRRNIMEAIDGSLRRLQTDYVDLYQAAGVLAAWLRRAHRQVPRRRPTAGGSHRQMDPVCALQRGTCRARHRRLRGDCP
jgi:aryl-alcohol dehydrogenase-like predicted oxidoreductase